MTLIKWNPAKELINFEREFNKMFRSLENRVGFPKKSVDEEFENAVWMPLTDIEEDEDNYILRIDLPGIKKEDVKISFSEGRLSISGERKQEKEKKTSTYHRMERTFGKYFRSFNLPSEIKDDSISAEFNDGALTVLIPKAEIVKPKEIEINVN